MWMSYATSLGILLALLLGWVAVQRAWRRTFAGGLSEPDALAARGGCLGCGYVAHCPKRGAEAAIGEENR